MENNGQLSFLISQSSSSGGGSCNTSCESNTQPLSSGSKNSPSSESSTNCNPNTNSNASGESSSKNNKKSSSNSSNSSDNNNSTQPPRLPIIYVLDGHVNKNSLTTSGKNKYWIEHELKKHHINSIKDVLIAMVDTQGKFVYQLYDTYDKNKKNKGAKK